MAYFSNGTEGMQWRGSNCDICYHDHNGEAPGCPVEEIHLLYNYDQNRKSARGKAIKIILETLIPTQDTAYGPFAGKCKLLVHVDVAGQLKLFPEGDRNAESEEEGKEETK